MPVSESVQDELAAMRARIAGASRLARRNPGNEPARTTLAKLRTEYAEAKLAAYINEAVEKAPPLSQAQADRLATLFRPALVVAA